MMHPPDLSEQENTRTKEVSLRTYTLPRLRFWLHVLQVIFTLLSVCMVAPVIAIQITFKGSSAPGPNYTLFVIILTFLIPVCLAFFPWMYDTKNHLKGCGKFFARPRTSLILTCFCSLLWLTAGIAITTFALKPDTCTLENNDSSAWIAQCNCAKVAIVFVWSTCLFWVITMIMAMVVFLKQKQLARKHLEHKVKINQDDPVQVEVMEGIVDHTPSVDPTLSPPYPTYYTTYEPSAPPIQYPLSSTPQYYSDTPPLQQPLAVMPDPQHYRHQHHVV
ncbi:hypothetical protein BC941DRAFT_510910 [Chlamydoabsidia padenii]|nr:hypothetical protein BC941DRAFT_510910 [Chlamydoabsidia padenii]